MATDTRVTGLGYTILPSNPWGLEQPDVPQDVQFIMQFPVRRKLVVMGYTSENTMLVILTSDYLEHLPLTEQVRTGVFLYMRDWVDKLVKSSGLTYAIFARSVADTAYGRLDGHDGYGDSGRGLAENRRRIEEALNEIERRFDEFMRYHELPRSPDTCVAPRSP